MAGTEVEHTNVDTGWQREPIDAPSARFGWHGSPVKTYVVASLISCAILLLMLRGNHVGHVEDWWLGVITAAVFFYTIFKIWPRHYAWRR